MSSKPRKLKSHKAHLFHALESKPLLLELLETAISSEQKTIFIKAVMKTHPDAFEDFDTGKDHDDLFNLFTGWFGTFVNSDALFPGISAAKQHRHQAILENRLLKLQFISDIGLDWTPDDKAKFISKVNSSFDLIGWSSFLS